MFLFRNIEFLQKSLLMIDLDSLEYNDIITIPSSISFLPTKETTWNGREITCLDSSSYLPELEKSIYQEKYLSNQRFLIKERQINKIDLTLNKPISAEGSSAPNGTILGGILIISGAIVWCFSPPTGMNLITLGVSTIALAEGENFIEKIKKK